MLVATHHCEYHRFFGKSENLIVAQIRFFFFFRIFFLFFLLILFFYFFIISVRFKSLLSFIIYVTYIFLDRCTLQKDCAFKTFATRCRIQTKRQMFVFKQSSSLSHKLLFMNLLLENANQNLLGEAVLSR